MMNWWRYSFVRFASVGATAAATHLLVVAVLSEVSGWPPLWANIPAFFVAFGVSYVGQKRLTFQSNGQMRQTLPRWLLISIGGFLLNQSLFALSLHFYPNTAYLLLLFIVTLVVAIITYGQARFWAFAHV